MLSGGVAEAAVAAAQLGETVRALLLAWQPPRCSGACARK